MRATCIVHLILFEFIILIISEEVHNLERHQQRNSSSVEWAVQSVFKQLSLPQPQFIFTDLLWVGKDRVKDCKAEIYIAGWFLT
jgi:uncharacterized membrane protein